MKTELNPDFWDEDQVLRLEIKEQLRFIADYVMDNISIEGNKVDVVDIIFTGSMANFNYRPNSDVDLHIVIAFKPNQDKKLIHQYLKTQARDWNLKHDVKVKGHNLEIYFQDREEKHHSNGIYSIVKNAWVVHPKQFDLVADEAIVDAKTDDIVAKIDSILTGKLHLSIKGLKTALARIYKFRKAGLDKSGEMSVENLVFKRLRDKGTIETLRNFIDKKESEKLSLESNFSTIGDMVNRRGPRHLKLDAGLYDRQHSQNLVAKCHQRKSNQDASVESLKTNSSGGSVISDAKAKDILTKYNMNFEKLKNGLRGFSKKLGKSNVEISYDPKKSIWKLKK